MGDRPRRIGHCDAHDLPEQRRFGVDLWLDVLVRSDGSTYQFVDQYQFSQPNSSNGCRIEVLRAQWRLAAVEWPARD